MANLVMYFCIIVEVRKALGATFFCTTIYTNVENTGYTNDTDHTHHNEHRRATAAVSPL